MEENGGVYKKGSLAALRAERANKKQQDSNKDNILCNNDESKTNDKNSLSSPDNNSNGHNQQNSGHIDAYGFFIKPDEAAEKLKEIHSDSHRSVIRKQNERIYKWLHMLDNWDTYNSTKKAKLKSRIRKGIPAPLRAKVWKKIMGVSQLTKDQRLYYSKIRYETPSEKFKTSIDNDLDRTFPRHILFTKSSPSSPSSSGSENIVNTSGRGKDSLRNVLYAFANHDSDVGYTQGMGFIVALLLMLMTEDDAFWCLCKLLDQNGDYALRGLYLDGLPLLHCRYYQFNELLLKFMPKLYEHINSFNITPALYASKWFITIFCYEFPFDFVYRIWDCYLNEGIKFVFRVSLGLMKMNETQLLRIKQFDEMMKFLQSIHKYAENVDFLLTKAFDLALKHEHLQEIEEKYNRMKLYEQRERGRTRGGRGREVSDMEPPAFLQRLSNPNNTPTPNTPNTLNTLNVAAPITPYTPSNDNDLNQMYKDKVKQEKKEEIVPDIISIDDDNKKETVIVEEEEKDKDNDDKKTDNKQDDGSHSDSSYVDDEPSSLLPNGKDHDIIPPPTTNGHDYDQKDKKQNNENQEDNDNEKEKESQNGYID